MEEPRKITHILGMLFNEQGETNPVRSEHKSKTSEIKWDFLSIYVDIN
jgi:hypothetical protein